MSTRGVLESGKAVNNDRLFSDLKGAARQLARKVARGRLAGAVFLELAQGAGLLNSSPTKMLRGPSGLPR